VWRRLIVPGSQNAEATSTPARIAKPPSAGVARSARPRSVGRTTAPIRRANLAAGGVSAVATTIATRNANRASQYCMASGEAWQGTRTIWLRQRLGYPRRDRDRLRLGWGA